MEENSEIRGGGGGGGGGGAKMEHDAADTRFLIAVAGY
jgi:hypothetical protein